MNGPPNSNSNQNQADNSSLGADTNETSEAKNPSYDAIEHDAQSRWNDTIIFFWNTPEWLAGEFNEMSLYKKLTLALSAGVLIAAIIAGIIYYHQLKAAQSQTIAAQRPWVNVVMNRQDKPITFTDNGVIIPVVFITQNVGNSPAIDVFVNTGAVLDGVGGAPAVWQKLKCVEAAQATTRRIGAITLFQQMEPFSQNYLLLIPKDMLEKAPDRGWMKPVVVGCVDYVFSWAPTDHHQTGFIYQIFGKDASTLRSDGGDISEWQISPYIYDSLGSGYFFAN